MAEESLAEFLGTGGHPDRNETVVSDDIPSYESTGNSSGLSAFLEDSEAPGNFLSEVDEERSPEETNALLTDLRNKTAGDAFYPWVDGASGYYLAGKADDALRPWVNNKLFGGDKAAGAFRNALVNTGSRVNPVGGGFMARHAFGPIANRLGGALLGSTLSPIGAAAGFLAPEAAWQLSQGEYAPDLFTAQPDWERMALHRKKLADKGQWYIPLPGQEGEPGINYIVGDAADKAWYHLNTSTADGGANPLIPKGGNPQFSLDPFTAGAALFDNTVGKDGLDVPAWKPTSGALFNNPGAIPGNIGEVFTGERSVWDLLGFGN